MSDQQSKEERLRQLGHDLRHSLHVVALGLELLREGGDDPERVHDICKSLDDERRQAETLIDELLEWARRGIRQQN